ncbi:periplasmic solute binding protein [Paenibacillus vortex V453]|uniref:Periplasmic solute binding protein n=1 Tax=Paenibacillus vortex V453 TaxID=715225 RepID=A0A2R9STD5_9BACL|nr:MULTISPECIES: metal ABC transporter substrate-binding protein [Paenibacillus]EFU40613.1 periplasmic solute binding protein [Paenibacillus vortex V453]MDH6671006.1 zinc transport system substrate-binding protein [Paenibacillus sp. LBL]MPY20343.1 zinc ABC transporter substrate-binding protein [Paenibacillus glucanolyticus]
MKRFKRMLTLLSLSAVLAIAGCGSGNSTVANEGSASPEGNQAADTSATETAKLQVKTSFYPMYEFTRQVAGDLAEVENLIPPGVEAHDWEPTPQDMAGITEADVLVYNGAGMEGWVDQVLESVQGTELTVIEASKGIEIMEGSGHSHEHEEDADHSHDEHAHEHEEEADHSHDEHAHEHEEDGHQHDHGGLDPHVWLSPAMAVQQVRSIEAGLAEAAPEHKEAFKANADAYVSKLEALDQEFRDGLKDAKRKDFITQHAAFGYLAREYGLTQVPIAGLSPDQEPSAAQMAEVIEFAKEHDVKTIFFETLVSSNVAETIASEIGASTSVLNPIEGLTDEDTAANLDYIAIMRQNLEALQKALNE